MSYVYDNDDFSRYYDTFVAEHISPDVYGTDTVDKIYIQVIERTLIDNQITVVVELGCGTGENLLLWKNHFQNGKVRLIGIDHSQAMLTRARQKFLDQSIDSMELLHGSLTNFSECLQTKLIDCILLPAGTFHHLISDIERQQFLTNLQETLRPVTGLLLLYLLPDSLIHLDVNPDPTNQDKFQLISTENLQQPKNEEWICKQTFEFNIPPKTELSWQLRTCSIPKLLQLFSSNNFEAVSCSFNGKDLLPFNTDFLASLNAISTPVILVFHRIKNPH